jgi:hypothetical protein
MRSAIPFDTHAYVKKLAAAGMPEPQAELVAGMLGEVVVEHLATKQDLALLRQDLLLLRQEVRSDLKELELRLAERLRSQMLWFFAVQTALLGIAIAVIKLVP